MIHINVYKQIELDDYQNGCLLEGGQDFGCIETLKAKNMPEALELIKSYGSEVYLFDDRIEMQKTENGDGNEPMEYQLEEWKKGNRKLYAATYSFYLSEVTTKSIKHDELKLNFPTLEEN